MTATHSLGLGRPARRLLLAPAALALSLAAQAQSLDLVGTGFLETTGPLEGVVQPLLATSSGGYSIGGEGDWSLYAPFNFNVSLGQGEGSFTFGRGVDLLRGSLGSVQLGPGRFALSYSITSGEGRFTGAFGTGSSVVTLTGSIGTDRFTFDEVGQISVVPEPASALLMLGGAAWLVVRRQRGRGQGSALASSE